MDFGGIIRRAWRVSWQHKSLWILGLFAGATGTSYGGGWSGSNYRFDSQDLSRWDSVSGLPSDVSAWVQDWVPVLIAAGVMLLLLGLLWLLLSFAAQAGLVWEVNAAEEGRPVSASEGWRVGFHYWGRVFLVGLVLMLPIMLLALVFAIGVALAVIVPFVQHASLAWMGVAGLVAASLLAIPVFLALGFVLGNMYVLAIRYLAIENRPAMDAVRASWYALRRRLKDVFLMWLITLGLGIAFGFVVAIPAAMLAVGIGVTAAVGVWPIAGALGVVLLVVVFVLMAAWNTFTSAMWTIFFRRLTGREVVHAQPAAPAYPGYAAAPPDAHYAPDPQPSYPAPPPPPPALAPEVR